MACHVRAVDPAVPDRDLVLVHTPHTTHHRRQQLDGEWTMFSFNEIRDTDRL